MLTKCKGCSTDYRLGLGHLKRQGSTQVIYPDFIQIFTRTWWYLKGDGMSGLLERYAFYKMKWKVHKKTVTKLRFLFLVFAYQQ